MFVFYFTDSLEFLSNIFFFKKLKKKKFLKKNFSNVFYFKKFKFLSSYTNKFDLSDFFFEGENPSFEKFFSHSDASTIVGNKKKNEEVVNSPEEVSDETKNLFFSDSQPFEFYQKFFFFNFFYNQKFFKTKKKNLKLNIFFFVFFVIKLFSKSQNLKNIFFERKKLIFLKEKNKFILSFFFLSPVFLFFKKYNEIIQKNNKKINLIKIFSSIFFFSKSFIFFNASILYSIFKFLPNSFFFTILNFFFKKIRFFNSKKITSAQPFYFFDSFLKKKIFSNIESKISNQFLFLNKFFLFFFENFFKSKIFFKIKFFKKIYNFIEKKLKLYNFYSKFN